jgi:hypothetical protein
VAAAEVKALAGVDILAIEPAMATHIHRVAHAARRVPVLPLTMAACP